MNRVLPFVRALSVAWLIVIGAPLGKSGAFAQSFPDSLSHSVRISVLTTDPGDALPTIGGHTALRIRDDAQKYDAIFDFAGIGGANPASFLHAIFYRKSGLIGHRNSYLGRFLVVPSMGRRNVIEQVLPFTPEQQVRFYESFVAEWNRSPETSGYDFLARNCTTIIRDLIRGTGIQLTPQFDGMTYHEVLLPLLSSGSGRRMAVVLMYGYASLSRIDRKSDLFLPVGLFESLDHTFEKEYAEDPSLRAEILTFPEESSSINPIPLWIFLLPVALGGVSWIQSRKAPSGLTFFDRLMWGLVGLFGAFLLSLALADTYFLAEWNPFILALSPSGLWVAISRSPAKALKVHTWISGLGILLCLPLLLSTDLRVGLFLLLVLSTIGFRSLLTYHGLDPSWAQKNNSRIDP